MGLPGWKPDWKTAEAPIPIVRGVVGNGTIFGADVILQLKVSIEGCQFISQRLH
jgi:hypothetical protein